MIDHEKHEMTRKAERSGLTAKCAKGREVRNGSVAHGIHGTHGKSERSELTTHGHLLSLMPERVVILFRTQINTSEPGLTADER